MRISFNIKVIALLQIVLIFGACGKITFVAPYNHLSAEEHNDLGRIYEDKGLLDLAEKEYEKAKKKNKGWFVPYFNLGNIEFKRNRYGKAEKWYRMALKINPGNPDVMNNLALCLLRQGKTEKAREMVHRALSIERKQEYLDTLKEIESAVIDKN
ncbi:MAG: tetratricopeptide repeat protein [Deltaproteobacteria bacterium]|nr:tetratricopeptide repeat protein [Deltaproteobacteria bacterium]